MALRLPGFGATMFLIVRGRLEVRLFLRDLGRKILRGQYSALKCCLKTGIDVLGALWTTIISELSSVITLRKMLAIRVPIRGLTD